MCLGFGLKINGTPISAEDAEYWSGNVFHVCGTCGGVPVKALRQAGAGRGKLMDRAKVYQTVFCCGQSWETAVPTGGFTLWICPLCNTVQSVKDKTTDPRQQAPSPNQESKPL